VARVYDPIHAFVITMPQNLDERTRSVIVKYSCVSLLILGIATFAAQWIVIPRLRRRSNIKGWTGPPLLLGCITTLVMMHLLSAAITLAIIAVGPSNSTTFTSSQFLTVSTPSAVPTSGDLTSSINFCEDDFADSRWIAEPANTASSLASYCPLALWGMFGLPSQEWSTRVVGHTRFGVAYACLFVIGIGSTLLHALLTAGAQGGDELPMLWFVASLSFIGLDIILQGTRIDLSALISTVVFGKHPSRAQKEARWVLHVLLGGSAVVATAIYCFSRENFLFFYIMFVLYATTATICLITISFFLKWNDDKAFRCNVLLPLAVCTSWTAIFAISAWVSEMLLCQNAQESQYGDVAKWLWNRAVHPFWHCSSAMLAWLLVQAMLAGQGLQRGWGEPQLQCASFWYGGVPYVTFQSSSSEHPSAGVKNRTTHPSTTSSSSSNNAVKQS